MMFDINPISLSAVQAFMRLTFVSQQTPDFALSILEQNSLFDLVLEIMESLDPKTLQTDMLPLAKAPALIALKKDEAA